MSETANKSETKKREGEVFIKIVAKKVPKFKPGAELSKSPREVKRWVNIELDEKHDEKSEEYGINVHLRATCEEDISDE